MILIQSPDGSEKCLVKSLDGYDGWSVIANPCRKPNEHEYWCADNQSWKPIEGAAAKAELLAKVRNPEQLADLLADILSRLPTLPE